VDARSASTGRGSHQNLGFPRAGRRLPRLLHVYVSTARPLDTAPSVLFVDDAARVLDRIPLGRVTRDGPHSALHGIVYALWKARRLGYRRVEVHCDDPAAVAQINGDGEIDAGAVGPYLEARALKHLYTYARIDYCERPKAAHESAAPRPECAMSFSS
jgi:hypothetical protein